MPNIHAVTLDPHSAFVFVQRPVAMFGTLVSGISPGFG
jgi:hypothetical protein